MEAKKRDLQNRVLEKSHEVMKKTVKVNTINKYGKVFFCELAFDASAFCNNL